MRVQVDQDMMDGQFRVSFILDEMKYRRWQASRFGAHSGPDPSAPVAGMLYLLTEFHRYESEAGTIHPVSVEVIEPTPQLPPSQ